MKILRMIILSILLVAFCHAAMAQCPDAIGQWSTNDGTKTCSTNYDYGQFWLTRDNTWADGLGDLTGVLTSFNVVTTITIRNFAAVGATSNINFTGDFVN
jgi:hypothetical protein